MSALPRARAKPDVRCSIFIWFERLDEVCRSPAVVSLAESSLARCAAARKSVFLDTKTNCPYQRICFYLRAEFVLPFSSDL